MSNRRRRTIHCLLATIASQRRGQRRSAERISGSSGDANRIWNARLRTAVVAVPITAVPTSSTRSNDVMVRAAGRGQWTLCGRAGGLVLRHEWRRESNTRRGQCCGVVVRARRRGQSPRRRYANRLTDLSTDLQLVIAARWLVNSYFFLRVVYAVPLFGAGPRIQFQTAVVQRLGLSLLKIKMCWDNLREYKFCCMMRIVENKLKYNFTCYKMRFLNIFLQNIQKRKAKKMTPLN